MQLLIAILVVVVGLRCSACALHGRVSDCSAGTVRCIDVGLRLQLNDQDRSPATEAWAPDPAPWLEQRSQGDPQPIEMTAWKERKRPRGLRLAAALSHSRSFRLDQPAPARGD